MQERLLELLKIAWQNEWRLESQLVERDNELERQRRIMQKEIDRYQNLAKMYKRSHQIQMGECPDERNSNLSH